MRSARIYHGMGPGRHLDSLELQLRSISEAVSVGHFGLLVSRNYLVQKKIKTLELEKAACLKDGLTLYKLNEQKLTELAHGLRARIIGAEPSVSGAGEGDIGEFLLLTIMGRLLQTPSSNPFFYAKLFFLGLNKGTEGEVDALKTRRAELEGILLLSGALDTIGYSGQGTAWLSGAAAKTAITAAIKHKMNELEDAIELSITELDHHRVELQSRALERINIKPLKRLCTTSRAKVDSLLRPWTFWDHFDTDLGSPTLGGAKPGWEAAAAAHSTQLLGRDENAAGASRSFPWDAPEVAGAGIQVPRRFLLKFLDTIYELMRSYEEFNTLLRHDLRRALRYYVLYSGDIALVLAQITAELETKLAAIGGHKTEAAKSAAAADISDLLFRREFLVRRRAYVDERQRQGAAAVANWYAKGKPLLALAGGVEAPAIVVNTVETDDDNSEAGPFGSLPLLAAGSAARAALMEADEAD